MASHRKHMTSVSADTHNGSYAHFSSLPVNTHEPFTHEPFTHELLPCGQKSQTSVCGPKPALTNATLYASYTVQKFGLRPNLMGTYGCGSDSLQVNHHACARKHRGSGSKDFCIQVPYQQPFEPTYGYRGSQVTRQWNSTQNQIFRVGSQSQPHDTEDG